MSLIKIIGKVSWAKEKWQNKYDEYINKIKELVENGKIRKTRYENYKKFIESIEELKR